MGGTKDTGAPVTKKGGRGIFFYREPPRKPAGTSQTITRVAPLQTLYATHPSQTVSTYHQSSYIAKTFYSTAPGARWPLLCSPRWSAPAWSPCSTTPPAEE